MKIIQVVSSNIPIEQTGKRRWGALELIQGEYQKHLINMGVTCEIRWLNEVEYDKDTIVHIHVANLCLEAQKRGIPYIYSNHDHTSAHYGRGSWLYKEQLAAIKGSVFSIAHGESVVDFFSETDKLFYLPHGVDIDFYKPSPIGLRFNPLLMIASNGMAGDYGIDRKGFRLGIEAAKKLDMPITILGSEANAKFFEIHKDLLEYERLTIVSSNPMESEKLEFLQSHKVFLHPSYLEFGSPNLTLLEAYSCDLPIVGAYDGKTEIKGLQVLKSLSVDEICDKIEYVNNNYDSVVHEMQVSDKNKHSWETIVKQLYRMYDAYLHINNIESTETIKEKYIKLYEKKH